jgi:hypothetical protein
MSIAFESEQAQLQKLRERLRQMSDDELIKFGKMLRGLSEPRVSVTPDPWKAQLEEARRVATTASERLTLAYASPRCSLVTLLASLSSRRPANLE